MQKLLAFLHRKILVYLRYLCLKFNEALTYDIVSFEQPGSGMKIYHAYAVKFHLKAGLW